MTHRPPDMRCRDFELGDILSITTSRLVSRRGMDGVYDILGFMVGESLFTHQLPRVRDEVAPFLLEQYPQLAEIEVPKRLDGKDKWMEWLSKMETKYGRVLSVEAIDPANHTHIDPMSELAMMGIPRERIIPVVLSGEEDSV